MNNTIKIISVYPNFLNKGGAQDVALQLAEKLNEEVMPVVLTETHFAEIVPDYWLSLIHISEPTRPY